MKRHVLFLFTLLIIGLLSACGSRGDGASAKDTTGADSSAAADNGSEEAGGKDSSSGGSEAGFSRKDFAARTASTIPVEVTTLTTGDIASSLVYSSALETEQIVDIYSRISGLVVAVYVQEGDKVAKGQRLLQIEKDELELAEQNASLEFQKQKGQFERFKALQDQELLSEEEFENARLNLRQAEIAWQQAALSLKHSTVTAPISGYAGDRPVRLGDRIQTSTKLLSIANLDEKIVQLFVPQSEFIRCYKGQLASVMSDVVPGVQLRGSVKRISPIIDPQSGTFKVVVAVKDPENHLRPGMFVTTRLVVDTHVNTRLLPKTALVYENERTYFFVIEDDKAQRIQLAKGFEDAEKVEALNDIAPGAKIVVLGQSGLKDGSTVKITNEKQFSWQQSSGQKQSS